MTIKRLSIILLSILFLQSCGLKFWYNRLDWVVPWYLDDYVELNDGQEERLEKALLYHLEWHRSNELSRYIVLIDDISNAIKNGTVANNYQQFDKQIQSLFDTLKQQVADDLLNLATSLNDEQVEQLLATLQKQQAKREKKFFRKSAAKRQKNFIKSLSSEYKDWIGRLSKEQKSTIKQWVSEVQPTAEEFFAFQKRWHQALQSALQQRHNATGQEQLKSLIFNSSRLYSESLELAYQQNELLAKHYTIQLYNSLSPKQTKKLLNKLNNYREDFTDLIDD